MPAKTNSDKIDELTKVTNTATAELDHLKSEVAGISAVQSEASQITTDLLARVAVLEAARKEDRDRETERRRNLITVSVAVLGFVGMIGAAIIGALLSPSILKLVGGD